MFASTKGRYALRVLADLAEHDTDENEYIPLKDIARRQEISEKYLEAIVKLLVKEKLLIGVRGKGGGYRLAKELNIWIIALSQLNRNGQDPVPNLARLRDSGQIAEAADVVIFIYRPEVYHRTFPQPFESIPEDEVAGKAMIDVAKGRNIGVFQFIVNFSASTTHFTDMEDEDDTFTGMRPVEEDAPF